MIKIIVACDKNRLIGSNGKMPWKIKEEMAHFKATTLNSVVIMGNNTYKSLNMQGLKDRDNIVITKDPINEKNKCFEKYPNDWKNNPLFVGSFDESIRCAKFIQPKKDIYIIGGASIYEIAIKSGIVDEIILSEIHGEYDGDTYFPLIPNSYYTDSIVDHKDFSIITYVKDCN